MADLLRRLHIEWFHPIGKYKRQQAKCGDYTDECKVSYFHDESPYLYHNKRRATSENRVTMSYDALPANWHAFALIAS
ncbi:MAG TPA: hypothetical protein EYN91_10845 [Candidatus Melainabacteria bacterium]|nr:hypothetical protein [Candidatus Melainabacteria bacterium]HIN66643.1 hypothetical protein [Candidatus Obscuribacterales bacterium]